MADKETKNGISERGFEDAIKQLTEVVNKIEDGRIPLAASLDQYERGMALIKHCRGILQAAEKKIEKIAEEKTGNEKQKPQ